MLSLDPIFAWPWLTLLLVAPAGWNLWFYRRRLPPGRARGPLIGLRLLSWTVVVLLTLRPSLHTVVESVEKSRIYLARDISDSMRVRDMPGRCSRAAAVDAALTREADALATLATHYDVVPLPFARAAGVEAAADTAATAVGDMLGRISDRSAGSRVNCVVLISDGRDNTGRGIRDGAADMSAREIPVHTVLCGQSSLGAGLVDALLTDLQCPPAIDNERDMPVTVKGIWRGLAGVRTRIECRIDDVETTVEAATPAHAAEAFTRILQVPINLEPGFHRLQVRLPEHAGEVSPANNRLELFFKVKDAGIQVLYLDAVVRPEYKFFRRLLETEAGISPTVKSPFWLQTPAGKEFLRTLVMRKYDVIVIGDMWRPMLSDTMWAAVRNVLRNRGAGLLVIGGTLSLDPRFWQHHPVYECLPVAFGAGAAEVRSFHTAVVPTRQDHFLCVPFFDAAGHPRAVLPEMLGLRSTAVTPRPLASVLIEDADGAPLFVVGSYFHGRTAFLATDCSWNWALDTDASRALYEQFWMRAIYWLARREDGLTATLSIFAGRTRYRLGTDIVITGDVMNDGNESVSDASVTLTIRDLDRETAIEAPMYEEHGRYVAAFSPATTGSYTLAATTRLADRDLVSNELRVTVFDTRVEDREILADAVAMKDLAGRTGGRFMHLADLGALLRGLPRQSDRITIRQTTSSLPLWDRWWLPALALALMSAEWVLRRRIGLP